MMTIILYHLLDIEKKDDKNRFEGWKNAFYPFGFVTLTNFSNIYDENVPSPLKRIVSSKYVLSTFECLIDLLCILWMINIYSIRKLHKLC